MPRLVVAAVSADYSQIRLRLARGESDGILGPDKPACRDEPGKCLPGGVRRKGMGGILWHFLDHYAFEQLDRIIGAKNARIDHGVVSLHSHVPDRHNTGFQSGRHGPVPLRQSNAFQLESIFSAILEAIRDIGRRLSHTLRPACIPTCPWNRNMRKNLVTIRDVWTEALQRPVLGFR